MKFYFARHGQVLPAEFYGDAQFPAGDTPLTELGKQQATILGKHMKSLGFKGKIYSSPYARALKTAEMIAAQTGSEIIPWAPMREIMKTCEAANEFTGMTLKEIKENFKYISPDATLEFPWWSTTAETLEDVVKRLGESLEELNISEDTMFIGHGASVKAMAIHLEIPPKLPEIYNCCLSMIDMDNKSSHRYMDTGHLPYDFLTMNSVIKSEDDARNMEALMKEEIKVPDFSQSKDCIKVLHIGDTFTHTYPYYEKLIAKIQPDIIIHTGDIADEIKAGRIKAMEPEYEKSLIKMSDILKKSNAGKVYVVPGNNDIPQLVKKHMSFAEIKEPDTVIDICGTSVTLTHTPFEMTKESEWYMYGHGILRDIHDTGETSENSTCYFNAMHKIRVFVMPEKIIYSYDRPEKYKAR